MSAPSTTGTHSDLGRRLQTYGELAVRVGLNLRAGQRLLIIGPLASGGVALDAAPLVREIAASAYRAGSPLVEAVWGDEPLQVDITSKASLQAVKSVKFLDGDGKEIESHSNGSSRESFGNDVTWSLSFTLKQKVDKATVVIESWADAKKVFVPVIVKVKLGL